MILSGSFDGFWSSHAAFISEEKNGKLKDHFVLLLSAVEMSILVVLFFLLMVQINNNLNNKINKLIMEPA